MQYMQDPILSRRKNMATRVVLIETDSRKVKEFFENGGDSLNLALTIFGKEPNGLTMVVFGDSGLMVYRMINRKTVGRRGRVVPD
jgi:hypothetical protein